jgi:hypothetical protein
MRSTWSLVARSMLRITRPSSVSTMYRDARRPRISVSPATHTRTRTRQQSVGPTLVSYLAHTFFLGAEQNGRVGVDERVAELRVECDESVLDGG